MLGDQKNVEETYHTKYTNLTGFFEQNVYFLTIYSKFPIFLLLS